jgi:hypothetical protein
MLAGRTREESWDGLAWLYEFKPPALTYSEA